MAADLKIPTRHGAQRALAAQSLGMLRLLIRGEPDPSPELWQQIGEALMHGDPPADGLVEWMVRQPNGRTLFEQAIEHGVGPSMPQPLKDFFALVEPVPSWIDWNEVEAGPRIVQRGGRDYFFVARDLALMGGYQASAFNRTLLLTGALEKGPVRRVAETAQWWHDCTQSQGMKRFGAGWKSTVRVRLIHALVRRRVKALPSWRMSDWGLPINQTDMAATALAFPLLQLVAGRMLGVPVTAAESETALHHGRYVAWLMGVEPRWLAWTEQDGLRLLYQLSLSITNPDETSQQLARALMDEPLQRPYSRFAGLRGRFERHRHLSVSRLLIGSLGMQQLGLPSRTLPWYPLLRAPLNFARHKLVRALPGGKDWLSRRGRRVSDEVIASMAGDTHAQVGQAAHAFTRGTT